MTPEEKINKMTVALQYILVTQHNSNCSFINSEDHKCDCHIIIASDCLKELADEGARIDC